MLDTEHLTLSRFQEYGVGTKKQSAGLTIKPVSAGKTRAELLRQRDLQFGTVVESKILTKPGAPTKIHIGMYTTHSLILILARLTFES